MFVIQTEFCLSRLITTSTVCMSCWWEPVCVCVWASQQRPASEVHCGKPTSAWGGQRLTLGLLRGLVDRPEDAPLIDRDLQTHTQSQIKAHTHLQDTQAHTLYNTHKHTHMTGNTQIPKPLREDVREVWEVIWSQVEKSDWNEEESLRGNLFLSAGFTNSHHFVLQKVPHTPPPLTASQLHLLYHLIQWNQPGMCKVWANTR